MSNFRYTEEKLEGLRAALVDERRAEHGTAEMDIEAALELVRLASLALEVGKCGASYIDPRIAYVEVQVDRDLWAALTTGSPVQLKAAGEFLRKKSDEAENEAERFTR